MCVGEGRHSSFSDCTFPQNRNWEWSGFRPDVNDNTSQCIGLLLVSLVELAADADIMVVVGSYRAARCWMEMKGSSTISCWFLNQLRNGFSETAMPMSRTITTFVRAFSWSVVSVAALEGEDLTTHVMKSQSTIPIVAPKLHWSYCTATATRPLTSTAIW